MVRKGKYKYITRKGMEEWDMLFDLENDPNEKKNIIRENPKIAEELKKELEPLPDPDKVKQGIMDSRAVYEFMQLAQTPSQQLLNEFWLDTSPENLQEPKVM